MTLRWCASDGRVTKFWVDNAVATARNSVWVGQPDEPVVLRRSDFGQPLIWVTGEFTAPSTIAGVKAGLGGSAKKFDGKFDIDWKPGRIGDHYQIQLHGNGAITGQVISG
jgi:hypothetical protein